MVALLYLFMDVILLLSLLYLHLLTSCLPACHVYHRVLCQGFEDATSSALAEVNGDATVPSMPPTKEASDILDPTAYRYCVHYTS